MSGFVLELLAWFALLSRPAVLLQLLPMAVLLLACLGLRRRSLRLRRLPWGLPFLPALALLGWGVALGGRRWGVGREGAEMALAWRGLRHLDTSAA